MNLLIPIEAGLTGLTIHYGEMKLQVTLKPITAMWSPSSPTKPVKEALRQIFHGEHAMNDAITAAKLAGVIK